jgi:hypothetical protein
MKVGDIVLLVDNTPRNAWNMGRIIQVIKDEGILQIRGKKHQIQVNESKVRIKKPESIKNTNWP